MTAATNKPRYRVPSVPVDAYVRLDEFADTDIAEYLRSRGYSVSGGPNIGFKAAEEPFNLLDVEALNHIETLAVCGQRAQAVHEALSLIGKAIGRPLQ